MGNSKEPNSCQYEYKMILDKLNIKIEPSSNLTKSSINSKVPPEWKDKSTDSDQSSGTAFSEKEDSRASMNELDPESAYSRDSSCSDVSSESESEITDVTPRSLLSASSSFPFDARERTKSDSKTKFPNNENEMNELTNDLRYLSMDCLGRMNSSHQRFTTKKTNMTFTKEELMKIERDNQILLQRIMKFQRPQHKTKAQNVQTRLSSSAINRRKVQKKMEKDNMLLLRKIQQAKPCVLPRAKSSSSKLTFR